VKCSSNAPIICLETSNALLLVAREGDEPNLECPSWMLSLSFHEKGEDGYCCEGDLYENGKPAHELAFSVVRVIVIQDRHSDDNGR
jgi:hypothetical protein